MIIDGAKKCNVCLASNVTERGWVVAVTAPPTQDSPGEPGIAFGPIDSVIQDPGYQVEHLCCQSCAMRRLSQWLGDQDTQTMQKGAA